MKIKLTTLLVIALAATKGKFVVVKGWPGFTWLDTAMMKRPYAELLQLARNREAQEKAEHPLERINFTDAGLEWFDVVANTQTRSWALPFKARGFTEGNPSNDGRYVAAFDHAQMCLVDMDPQPPLQTYAGGNRRIGPTTPHGCIGFNDSVNDLRLNIKLNSKESKSRDITSGIEHLNIV